MTPRVAILALGSEILAGSTLDTNTNFLAKKATELGFLVTRLLAVKDEALSIRSALLYLIEQADIVFITGGLGPTFDDITKKTLAEIIEQPLIAFPKVIKQLETRLAKRRGLKALLNHYGYYPKGSVVFPNAVGIAPSFGFCWKNAWIFSMPGVPSEMKDVFVNQIQPYVLKVWPPEKKEKVLVASYSGIGEWDWIQKMKANFPPNDPEIECGIYPHIGQIKVLMKFSPRLKNRAEQFKRWQKLLGDSFPMHFLGFEDLSLSEYLMRLLIKKKKTLAFSESLTGGLLGKMLTDISGSSQVFRGCSVVYSDQAKNDVLTIPQEILNKYGAVSKPVAQLMAKRARDLYKSDYALATTGFAGPDANATDTGTVFVALDTAKSTQVHRFLFKGKRDKIRFQTAQAAFSILFHHLKSN